MPILPVHTLWQATFFNLSYYMDESNFHMICSKRKQIFWSITHVGFNCHVLCALVRIWRQMWELLSFSTFTNALWALLQNSHCPKFRTKNLPRKKDVLTCSGKQTKRSNFGGKKTQWLCDENPDKKLTGEAEPCILGSPPSHLHILCQPSGDHTGEF